MNPPFHCPGCNTPSEITDAQLAMLDTKMICPTCGFIIVRPSITPPPGVPGMLTMTCSDGTRVALYAVFPAARPRTLGQIMIEVPGRGLSVFPFTRFSSTNGNMSVEGTCGFDRFFELMAVDKARKNEAATPAGGLLSVVDFNPPDVAPDLVPASEAETRCGVFLSNITKWKNAELIRWREPRPDERLGKTKLLVSLGDVKREAEQMERRKQERRP